jgi:similar to spore coat protein
MAQQGLAVHETMELHELLMFKSTCMTKSNTMQALTTDGDLRSLMQQDVEQSSKAINQLQSILQRVQTQ